jgi:GGDEF domain-containing protein
MLFASGTVAHSNSLRESSEPPVSPHRSGQTVLWLGEELAVEPKETFVQEYSSFILAGMLGLMLGLFFYARCCASTRSRAESPNEKMIDEAVDALFKDKSGGSIAIVPRALPNSPFTEKSDIHTLVRQIEIAARASARLSRSFGLIYFEPHGYAQFEEQHGHKNTRQAMSSLVSELRSSLRSSDHAALLDDHSILICICLLASLSDLESVAQRMFSVVARLGLTVETQQRAGLAIYPLNGYSGDDLIRAAQENFLSAAGTGKEI